MGKYIQRSRWHYQEIKCWYKEHRSNQVDHYNYSYSIHDIPRAKSVPIHGRENKINEITDKEAGTVYNLKENIYLTEIPGQQTKQDIKKDMTTSTDNLEDKPTEYKGKIHIHYGEGWVGKTRGADEWEDQREMYKL